MAETPRPQNKSACMNIRPDKLKHTSGIIRADIDSSQGIVKLSELKKLRLVKIPAMITIEQELGKFIPCVPGLRF